MKHVKSCGFVAFKKVNNKNLYLIIKSINGDIGFPKGHTEPGESEIQTAIRELKEETGVEVKVVPKFRRQLEYRLKRSEETIKQSIYFLGECTLDNIVCQQTEVVWADFLCYNDAMKLLTFEETKRVLADAESFIRHTSRP